MSPDLCKRCTKKNSHLIGKSAYFRKRIPAEKIRDEVIKFLKTGLSVPVIANKVGVTERWVFELIKRSKKP